MCDYGCNYTDMLQAEIKSMDCVQHRAENISPTQVPVSCVPLPYAYAVHLSVRLPIGSSADHLAVSL